MFSGNGFLLLNLILLEGLVLPPVCIAKSLIVSPIRSTISNEIDELTEQLKPLQKNALSDIEKLRKIGEILQTVNENIIPILINSQQQLKDTVIQSEILTAPMITSSTSSASSGGGKAVQLIHELKKDVDELAKNKNSP